MASKLTTRPLQRISLVGSNREGWIGDHVAGLVGVKNTTDEDSVRGTWKLTTLAPQVSYSKPKRPNYYAKTVPFQSCGSAVVPGCRSMNRSLRRVANQALSTVLAP